MLAVISAYNGFYIVLLYAEIDKKSKDYVYIDDYIVETWKEVQNILALNNVIKSILIPFKYEINNADETRNDE